MPQYDRMRVTIGNSGDFELEPDDFEDWAGPIRRALKAGHRWLVFLDDQSGEGSSFGMKTGIDLGDPEIDGLPYLRLQGGGRNITHLTRRPGNTDPLFFSPTTTTWRIHIDGVTFHGEKQHTGHPLCAFGAVEDSVLKFSSFSKSGDKAAQDIAGDDGLHLGMDRNGSTAHARRIVCLHTEFDNNADAALRVHGADNIVLVGSAIEHNGHENASAYGGMEWKGTTPHGGVAFSCHFEENAQQGALGVQVIDGRCVRIANCYQWASKIILTSTTQSSLYQNNLIVDDTQFPGIDDQDSNLEEHNYPGP
jgi:hypothetical protein